MTAIEWTHMPGFKGESWNPIVGCSVLTKGCTNCYAMKQAARIIAMTKGETHYRGLVKTVNGKPVWTGSIRAAPDRVWEAPLRAKKPRCYFVNSMGDVFYETVPDEWIDRLFAIMALSPQHRFLILTKRPERMREYLARPGVMVRIGLEALGVVLGEMARHPSSKIGSGVLIKGSDINPGGLVHWPLPNVWLGVSVEDQVTADARIPDLLSTPAAKRFVSAEPLLGEINLSVLSVADPTVVAAYHRGGGDSDSALWLNALSGDYADEDDVCNDEVLGRADGLSPLDWIIAGGESGPDARPLHPDWARSLRDQCASATVPFFFKQWGEWLPWSHFNSTEINDEADNAKSSRYPAAVWGSRCGAGVAKWNHYDAGDTPWMVVDEWHHECEWVGRVGKKAADHLLDGWIHHAFPEARPS